MQPNSKQGFTLLELLIVIAIIGLLATFAALGLSNSRERARDTKRVNDLRQIRKALELAFNQGNGYPVAATPVVLGDATHKTLCGKGDTINLTADTSTANCDSDKIYVGLLPPDPAPTGQYLYQGTVNSFCIETVLEVGTENLTAGTIIADTDSFRNGTCP